MSENRDMRQDKHMVSWSPVKQTLPVHDHRYKMFGVHDIREHPASKGICYMYLM